MSFSLTKNFLAFARGITFGDGGGLTWSFNKNTNTISAVGSAGGVLSSVGLSDASTTPIYTVGNSPLTANGTISLTLKTQGANLVFAGPTSGGNAQPTFRALVAADVPSSILPGGFTGFANPTAKVGTAVVNGSATTAMRSDAAPPIDLTASFAWTGVHSMSAVPLTGGTTRPMTGLAAFKSSPSNSSSSGLVSDAALTLTYNETGWYEIEVYLAFFEATSGAGGFEFDMLNGGTAAYGTQLYSWVGWDTAAKSAAGLVNSGVAITFATISTSSSAPSWVRVKGVVQITSTGTAILQWGQNSTNANPTTLMAGSFVKATKIG